MPPWRRLSDRAARLLGRRVPRVAAAQDPNRGSHRQRRPALAGDLHRRRGGFAQRQGGRQLGFGRGAAQALLALDAAERRALLFPFLWGTVAKRGQIFGNQALGSVAHVTNGKAFSYPGYNEMTTGYPNDAIDSNEFGPNPNATVFEWLNNTTSFAARWRSTAPGTCTTTFSTSSAAVS
jgi:hypothetical protein